MSWYFLDTSVLVKRYHLVDGSPAVDSLFDDHAHGLVISRLAVVEFQSAIARQLIGCLAIEFPKALLCRQKTPRRRSPKILGHGKARNSRKTDDMVRVSFSFDGSDYAEIQSIAKAKKVSVAWVVRDGVSA